MTSTGGVSRSADPGGGTGGTVTYQFVASTPGTHAYYSGTQGDLQIEMGLYGAIIVLPATAPAVCGSLGSRRHDRLPATNPRGSQGPRSLGSPRATSASPRCLRPSRHLLRPGVHVPVRGDGSQHPQPGVGAGHDDSAAVRAPVLRLRASEVPTEPYHPTYFLVNGRSMPDDMDPNFRPRLSAPALQRQPAHASGGGLILIRVIGQGRWQHPFHEHANHVRILARDGNLILSNSAITYAGTNTPTAALAGMLMFTTDTFPGQSFDGIFYYTGKGLNWDMYGHNPGSTDPLATLPCIPDANGYNTGAPTAVNYFEWCQDHNKPLEANPFGDVAAGGPMTLPNANILTNGAWYGGSPYLGPDATLRAVTALRGTGGYGASPGCSGSLNANCSSQQPSNIQANPANERGFAFMWHSHNEREITTNNVFPGGMFMMMMVDSREFVIDESN